MLLFRPAPSLPVQTVGFGSGRSQVQLPGRLQDADALADIAEVQRGVEPVHDAALHLSDLHHLLELLQLPCDEVEEGQALKVVRLLVAELDDIKIPLSKGLNA